MITAVFDCMVYLQAADNRNGAAGACLGLVEDGHVRLLASPDRRQRTAHPLPAARSG
jgi:hypothetical protein